MMEGAKISRERIEALSHESIAVVPYDPKWPVLFADAKAELERALPSGFVQRVNHIGSTAVPGLSAKPIIDIQVEVSSLACVVTEVVPIMERLGHEFIWRPSIGEKTPFYAWFIKRDPIGKRIRHVHMVESDAATIDRIRFRDILRGSPEILSRYEALKKELADRYPHDRAGYTQGKTEFIAGILAG